MTSQSFRPLLLELTLYVRVYVIRTFAAKLQADKKAYPRFAGCRSFSIKRQCRAACCWKMKWSRWWRHRVDAAARHGWRIDAHERTCMSSVCCRERGGVCLLMLIDFAIATSICYVCTTNMRDVYTSIIRDFSTLSMWVLYNRHAGCLFKLDLYVRNL